jgi:hypothetical protein
MSDTAVRLAGPTLLTGTEATLYTVPADTTAILRHIRLANSTATAATVRLSIGAYAAGTALLGDVSIPANGTYDWSGFAVLAAAETLRGSAGTTNALAVTVSGVEVTADGDGGAVACEIGIACSDESTAITQGNGKATFRMPYAMTVTAVRASLKTACATGTFTVDINEAGTTILSTKLTIDATEKTSETAAAAAVISDSALADDAEITIDVDDDASGDGVGLKVWIIGTRA